MDVVKVGGKRYDPYFILDVTKDDSDEHIKRSFREKVKRYHPDRYTDPAKRKKYELYFQILSESFDYIRTKRSSTNVDTRRRSSKSTTRSKQDQERSKKMSPNTFNKTFCESSDVNRNKPEDFGYSATRTSTVKEYKNFEVNNYNQFSDRKFSEREFNRIFDYIKQQQSQESQTRQLQVVHKTTDGFNGYNCNDVGECALISSFNGLLITGDDLGERGIGYWGDRYGDYKMSYETARNPNRRVKVPKDFVKPEPTRSTQTSTDYSHVVSDIKRQLSNDITFQSETNTLYQKTYSDLVEQERRDREFVLKYANQYDANTVQQALNGELETSPTYTSVLHKYIQ